MGAYINHAIYKINWRLRETWFIPAKKQIALNCNPIEVANNKNWEVIQARVPANTDNLITRIRCFRFQFFLQQSFSIEYKGFAQIQKVSLLRLLFSLEKIGKSARLKRKRVCDFLCLPIMDPRRVYFFNVPSLICDLVSKTSENYDFNGNPTSARRANNLLQVSHILQPPVKRFDLKNAALISVKYTFRLIKPLPQFVTWLHGICGMTAERLRRQGKPHTWDRSAAFEDWDVTMSRLG